MFHLAPVGLVGQGAVLKQNTIKYLAPVGRVGRAVYVVKFKISCARWSGWASNYVLKLNLAPVGRVGQAVLY